MFRAIVDWKRYIQSYGIQLLPNHRSVPEGVENCAKIIELVN
jgi:hypothetical protein